MLTLLLRLAIPAYPKTTTIICINSKKFWKNYLRLASLTFRTLWRDTTDT